MDATVTSREHILITGGAGYIGSSLVGLLLDNGYEVTVYDVFRYGVRPLLCYAAHDHLHLVRGDILDKGHLAAAMRGKQGVIHLAALPGYPACDRNPDDARRINEQGTRHVTELLPKGVKLIFASTGVAYGAAPPVVTEETPLHPISLYARGKAHGERLVTTAGGLVLRIATLYGASPQLRLDLFVNHLTAKATLTGHIDLYEPEFQRTFLHVRDMGRAFLLGMRKYELMRGGVYNVGDNDMDMTKQQVAMAICTKVPGCVITPSAEQDKEKRDYMVRFDKIRALGFRASISLEQGIEEIMTAVSCSTAIEREKWRFNSV